uniref:Major sperm protein n=1 Tax=Caenorhabditis japonica TaxID=281687 RepID=A0A8R1HWS6_CAEJA
PKSSRSSRSSRSTRTARAAPDEVSDESKPAGSGSSPNGRKSSRSSTDVAGGPGRYKDGANPMESSSFHKLKTESDGFAGTLVGPGNNLHDMLFFPMDRIVFNGPFDIDNITYHMKVVNNSHHRLAYAIKGNAVPRVMANPAFGILKSKEERLLAVTVQKFEWDDVHFEKDRIAFDYILLADNNKTEKFALDMFKKSESKRRKNILIQYNP